MAAMASGVYQCCFSVLTYCCCCSGEMFFRQSKRASIWAKMVGMSRTGSRYVLDGAGADIRVGVVS